MYQNKFWFLLSVETTIDRESDFAREIAEQNRLKELLAAEEAAHKSTKVRHTRAQSLKNPDLCFKFNWWYCPTFASRVNWLRRLQIMQAL